MRYRNERAHNLKYEVGNVNDTFQKMRNIINVNDGTRSFSFRTVDCHDQPAPFHQGQYSQISLTHPDHFISDIDKGFLTFHIKLDLQLNTDWPNCKRSMIQITSINCSLDLSPRTNCLTGSRFSITMSMSDISKMNAFARASYTRF